jgi:lysophospholipase L1-like esterase
VRLAIIAAVMLGLGAATYALPQAERVRPWVGGEGMPIARLFLDELEAPPTFAEATRYTGTGRMEDLEAAVGHAVAETVKAPLAGKPKPAQSPAAAIAPSEWEGMTAPIEGAEHIAPFFQALARTLKKERGAITRVAHYGDSSVAADSITSTARRRLQKRFGDSGHGFILISRGNMHYMHKDVVHRASDGWDVRSCVHASLRDGLYGYGGVQARAPGGQSATFGTVEDGGIGSRVASFELFYQRSRGSGAVQLRVDRDEPIVIKTASDELEDAFERIEVPDGEHSLSLRTIGSMTRLYGVALERKVPGVVYDSLGLVGAMAERLLEIDGEHIQRQLEHRNPDLVVLAFGGNESANRWLNPERYEEGITRVVRHMRGSSKRPCMLFAPLDQGERDKRGKVVTVEVLPSIIEAQRRVAKQEGCAFFDTYAAMGGEGAMARWLKVRPRLATSDMRHATPKGYDVIGTLYYKALLHAFAGHLGKR